MPQSGFTPIITYNTATASAAPSASNLTQGELAVNVTDKKLFTKDSSAAVVQVGSGPSATDTLSNKTIALGSNTVSGTLAQFNTAVTDAELVSLAGSETLTNKTLTAPTITNPTFTASSGDAVKITNTGTGNSFVVEDSASTDSTPFVIDASGRTIIGNTTSVGGTFGNQSQLQNLSFGAMTTGRFYNDASAPALDFIKSRNGTTGSHTVVQSGDSLTDFYFSGSDGTAFIRAAQITAAVDGTPGTNDMPGRLVFSTTADGASSPTERMRIDSAGSVGIGGASSGSEKLLFTGTLPASGGYTFGTRNSATFNPAVTTTAGYAFYTDHTVSTGTLPGLSLYHASQGTYTGTVTTQYGFHASSGLTGAGTNYGFFSNIAASGSTRYNFYANGTAPNRFVGETLVIGAAGLGYGTGAGGTVTQATSKSTAVTLNKPCGQITMHNAALAANTVVYFTLTNSLLTAADTISLSLKTGYAGFGTYIIQAESVTAGSATIVLKNISGVSLSEAIVFSFAIIKGATS